jgi:hypothetical protein
MRLTVAVGESGMGPADTVDLAGIGGTHDGQQQLITLADVGGQV